MYQTPKKVFMTYSGATKLSNIFQDSMSNSTARSAGDVWEGLSNGIATGFGGEYLIPTASFAPTMLVAASAGGDLATPVAYWFAKQPVRIRVGSTGAAAVPATSGITKCSANSTGSRGILRMGLGDVNAAAQMILDQGTMAYLDLRSDFEVHYDIAAIENSTILSTAGYADFGVAVGATGVDPTVAPASNCLFVRFTQGKAVLYKTVSNTVTALGMCEIPSGSFVLTFRYDHKTRRLFGVINGHGIGEESSIVAPVAWTHMQMSGRVCHLAAYAAATDAPIAVELDSLIVTQFSSGNVAREKL
jgi:hypothetical protein